MPEWVEPMAATLTDKRFKDPDWTFEGVHEVVILARKRSRVSEIETDTSEAPPSVGPYR